MKSRKNLSVFGVFALAAAKCTRCHALFRLEGFDKIRQIVEPAGIRDVGHGQIGAEQLSACTLDAVGIDRDEVYIANILKCRPPNNRDPKPEEEDLCIDYLREQVQAIRPKVIVCLGRISAMRIIKKDFKITAEHVKWFDKNGYSVCAVYHPAALLRDPRKKDEMLADMIAIKERLDGIS